MFRNLVRLTFTFVRWVIPWIMRFLRLLGSLLITSISSIYVGIPKAVERISDSWTEQAGEMGLPVSYHRVLRIGARTVATITLILGWLVLASLTVYLIRLVW